MATASAVDMMLPGFSTAQPSVVSPWRRSRKMVTRVSTTTVSTVPWACALSMACWVLVFTRLTSTFRSAMGSMCSKLKRRLSAALISLTPLSLRLAVAMTQNPSRAASECSPSSGMAMRRSERMGTSASWISGWHRVISSMRATLPVAMAWRTGDGTSASVLGPWASSMA